MKSNCFERARILESPGKQRTVRVELLAQLLYRERAPPPPVFELPTLWWCQQTRVAFTQLARASATVGGRIEPHSELGCVEGERRGRGGAASGPGTLSGSHDGTVQRLRAKNVEG